jgi:hypothetical protein
MWRTCPGTAGNRQTGFQPNGLGIQPGFTHVRH